jgi:hypothetical protein
VEVITIGVIRGMTVVRIKAMIVEIQEMTTILQVMIMEVQATIMEETMIPEEHPVGIDSFIDCLLNEMR